jgi:hypothetical protein
MKNRNKLVCVLVLALLLVGLFSTTALAAGTGDVAGAIEGTWDDLILAVFFFAKLGMAYFDYRKHGQFEWSAPAILFACLVFTLTCPLYIWTILGM